MSKKSKKPSDKAAEAETAPTPEPEAKQAPAKATKAVFVPVGNVKVHLDTPSGNEYNLVPKEVFTIAAEDVDWLFNDLDWSFRKRLVLASDYNPTCGYHDPKAGEKDYRPHREYHDPAAAAATPTEAPVEAEVKAPADVAVEAEADSGEKE